MTEKLSHLGYNFSVVEMFQRINLILFSIKNILRNIVIYDNMYKLYKKFGEL